MKYLALLILIAPLFALAPLAHAAGAGQDCVPGVAGACDPGLTCDATFDTCISSSGGGSTGNPVSPPGGGSTGNPVAPPANTGGGSGSTVTLLNPLNAGTSLSSLLTEILAFVVRIGTVVIVLMVVYVGFKFVMAQGEPGKISEAREALLWTIVGALILLGAQAIASAIQATAQAL